MRSTARTPVTTSGSASRNAPQTHSATKNGSFHASGSQKLTSEAAKHRRRQHEERGFFQAEQPEYDQQQRQLDGR